MEFSLSVDHHQLKIPLRKIASIKPFINNLKQILCQQMH